VTPARYRLARPLMALGALADLIVIVLPGPVLAKQG
jgi:hypothetical protein